MSDDHKPGMAELRTVIKHDLMDRVTKFARRTQFSKKMAIVKLLEIGLNVAELGQARADANKEYK